MADSSFGTLLVELGYVTEDQLADVSQNGAASISDALLSLGHVTRPQLNDALHSVTRRVVPAPVKRPLGELLVERGVCTYEEVFDALHMQTADTERQQRIVVIDDSPLARALLVQGLGNCGYDVVAFAEPEVALAEIAASPPDLVVTDRDMPGLDGAEVCRRIKDTSPDLPVIILTAQRSATAVSGLQAGADDYVHKETSIEELAARITTVLRRTNATNQVREVFARYTSDAVVAHALEASVVAGAGMRRDVTVLFADVRNFTSFSEQHSPERVMSALNDVLGKLADAVISRDGTVDKFLGDGLMAVFGAPREMTDHPKRALAAALGMLRAIDVRNGAVSPELVLEVGVAINTGHVIAGSIGNARRMEYTCIGDVVNVASRLCGLAEPGEILVGGATAARLNDRSSLDELPAVQLKGKQRTVPVFRARR